MNFPLEEMKLLAIERSLRACAGRYRVCPPGKQVPAGIGREASCGKLFTLGSVKAGRLQCFCHWARRGACPAPCAVVRAVG